MILYPSGSWDHLAVKRKVKIKLPEVVRDDTDNETEGSPLVPVTGKGKEKGKMPVTQLFQIEGGYLVYDPKMLNEKIGSIKVRPRQPGKNNSIYPVVSAASLMADSFVVTVSIEKPTPDHVLELDRIRAKVNILENDQDPMEKEIQQLGASLVFINQGSSHSGQGEGALNGFFQCFNEVEVALSGVRQHRDQLSAKLQELSTLAEEELKEQWNLAEYLGHQ
jgi:hypothetical protein